MVNCATWARCNTDREVFDIVIQHSHTRDMLLHSGPLGLAHRLLNVEPLSFGCVSTEDCELM
jgi:hypothetical protein